jgi:molecular chaperone GrpE
MNKKSELIEKTMESNASRTADSGPEGAIDPPQGVEAHEPQTLADEVKAAVDRYVRLAAEFENYKKRAQKDQAEYTKYANERLLKELLPVLDNLQRALQHVQQAGSSNGLVQGVELTCKQCMEIFSRFGIKQIPSVGLPFDPAVHQAVALVEAHEGQAPNTVVVEHEKGYYLHDRVLRPAVVTVVGSAETPG